MAPDEHRGSGADDSDVGLRTAKIFTSVPRRSHQLGLPGLEVRQNGAGIWAVYCDSGDEADKYINRSRCRCRLRLICVAATQIDTEVKGATRFH